MARRHPQQLQLLRRLDASAGGPSTTLYVVVGAAVGLVALLVVAVGVALCRRERRRARALADLEQYVHVGPAPPASQLSPGIAAAKPALHAPLAVSSGGSGSFDAAVGPSSYYAVTSPTGLRALGSYAPADDRGRAGSALVVQTVALPASPSLSQRSRSNSFEKHDSYRRFMYGEPATAETEPPISAGGSALWDDPTIQAARVPLDRLALGRVLSRGGFGEVLDGDYRGQRVAVKRLLPETRREMRHIEQFLSEIRLLATLEHPRVVRFVGVAWEALSDLCAVSEFMVGGDLRSLLAAFDGDESAATSAQHARRPRGFDADKARIALDVAHALTYLHSLEPMVLHRDLKSRNVLLDEQLRAKLTDFGVSRERLGDNSTLTAGVGTLLWMAPEVMMGDRYDHKADMFSFGVLLSELDTQQLPYAHAKVTDTGRTIPDAALLQLVACGELRANFSPASSPGRERLVRLGESCLALEPEQRPTAAETLYQLQLAVRECEEEAAAARNPRLGTGMTESVASSEVDENRSYLF